MGLAIYLACSVIIGVACVVIGWRRGRRPVRCLAPLFLLVGLPYAEIFIWRPLWLWHVSDSCGPPVSEPLFKIEAVERVRVTGSPFLRLEHANYEVAFLLQRYRHVEVPDPADPARFVEVETVSADAVSCLDSSAGNEVRYLRFRADDGNPATLDCLRLRAAGAGNAKAHSFEVPSPRVLIDPGSDELWRMEQDVLVDGEVAMHQVSRTFVQPSIFLRMAKSRALLATCTTAVYDETLLRIESYLVPAPRTQ